MTKEVEILRNALEEAIDRLNPQGKVSYTREEVILGIEDDLKEADKVRDET